MHRARNFVVRATDGRSFTLDHPRDGADFGAVIDFLKNLAILGGLLMVVLAERAAGWR